MKLFASVKDGCRIVFNGEFKSLLFYRTPKHTLNFLVEEINAAHEKAVADRDARIAELEKALSVCERAIKALLVMMDRGDRPSKLDEALTWTQNDNLAKSLGRNAVEEIRKALGKGE